MSDRRYVDHPAPSIGLMVMVSFSIVFLILAIPAIFDLSLRERVAGGVVIFLVLVTLCFYLWPLYSTYYTVSAAGIQVRYGPWARQYPWSDFTTAYWQKGLFTTRIGWPWVTPCVRLSDCVLFQRRTKQFGLYLTPNDSRAFLKRITEFAPELTAELIV